MKKKDFLILLVGIFLIVLLFYRFQKIEYIFFLIILILLGIIALFFLMLFFKRKISLKKESTKITYIFSCCFVNDDVNFSKLCQLIMRKIPNESFKMTALNFINYLEDKNKLISFTGKESLEELIKKVNFLVHNCDLEFELSLEEFQKQAASFMRIEKLSRIEDFLQNLNVIAVMIRKKNYELMQIYPASMYKKNTQYYFAILPIDKLLEVGEIGFLG